jgi:hypothetical protein
MHHHSCLFFDLCRCMHCPLVCALMTPQRALVGRARPMCISNHQIMEGLGDALVRAKAGHLQCRCPMVRAGNLAESKIRVSFPSPPVIVWWLDGFDRGEQVQARSERAGSSNPSHVGSLPFTLRFIVLILCFVAIHIKSPSALFSFSLSHTWTNHLHSRRLHSFLFPRQLLG